MLLSTLPEASTAALTDAPLYVQIAETLLQQVASGGSATNIGGRGKTAYETYQDTNGNYWISVGDGAFRVRGNALEPVATDVTCPRPFCRSRWRFVDRD